jgi:hypothetical protein
MEEFFRTLKPKDHYSVAEMEINWREMVSQIISPDPSLSALFLQHSTMHSEQACSEEEVLEADQSIK